jgi:hypothetical protein
MEPWNWSKVRKCAFVTVQEHVIDYCRCKDAIKLFRFLLAPYTLLRARSSVQICTFANRMSKGLGYHKV